MVGLELVITNRVVRYEKFPLDRITANVDEQ